MNFIVGDSYTNIANDNERIIYCGVYQFNKYVYHIMKLMHMQY